MSLQIYDVVRIAALSRIEVTPAELEQLHHNINNFLNLVEAMQAVDTAGVEPLSHPIAAIEPMTLRLRDDVVSEPDQRVANQHNAPSIERGLFLVPKVIE
jgi:aspartyl-tRNA(Asn)/glutamyl-tRNA(Gln) amidotransferase subunit C